MTTDKLGLPNYSELKSIAKDPEKAFWSKGTSFYLKGINNEQIDSTPFHYKMKYTSEQSVDDLLKNANFKKLIIDDLNEANMALSSVFDTYLKIQNNFLRHSKSKIVDISRIDSLKSIIPVLGLFDLTLEKIKRRVVGKYKPSNTQRGHIIGLNVDFYKITEEFFHKGVEKIVIEYINKLELLKNKVPILNKPLSSLKERAIENVVKLSERNDICYKIHLTNTLKAMKKYNTRSNIRLALKAVTLGLK